MKARVALEHVGAGCNRVVGCLDWSECGLIAYGAHRAVVIYDPESGKVIATAIGHDDVVKCVRWVPSPNVPPSGPRALVSGSGDGTICIWLISTTPEQPWSLAARLAAHTAPVTSAALHCSDASGALLLVSTGGDGDVVIWQASSASADSLSQDAWRQVQRLSFGTRLQHCAALCTLPSNSSCCMLALGGVDGQVRIFCREEENTEFRAACNLTGHQNWVRGLALAPRGQGLLLASASQDRYIRLWSIAPEQAEEQQAQPLGTGEGAVQEQLMRYAPRPKFRLQGGAFSATLHALLVGHEDWVHSVAWRPAGSGSRDGGTGGKDELCLLSASMDRTMMIWVPDEKTGLWLSQESVGDAGVNHLGYFTGVWGRGGTSIASHGFTGALHIWRRTPEGDLCPDRAVGGHYGAIVDACWAADGASLLTVSCDQTARITALITGEQSQWCEIARPQVHGHDFSCVAAIPPRDGGGSQIYRYTSGSEEKVLRVFEAPRAFHDTLAMAKGDTALGPRTPAITTAYGATLPALGLSNKAFNYEDGDAAGADALPEGMDPMFSSGGPDVAPACAPSAVAGPPLEEHLSQNTLWPEIHKLYGHGNEVHCVAADPHGEFLASASRAQSASTAGIIVWDTATWTARAVLEAHTLTVTQLAFSPCGRYLASCSRDRTVAVFTRTDAPAQPFVLSSHAKAHSRIVWGLGWSSDSQLLATAARDGAVKVWSVGEHGRLGGTPLCTVALGDSVRSVAFAPSMPADGAYLVAAGLEGGEVVLASLRWPLGADAAEWTQLWRTSCFEQHAAAVRRLCWRIEAGAEESVLELASCSDDHGIRIFRVERA